MTKMEESLLFNAAFQGLTFNAEAALWAFTSQNI